MSEVPAPRPAPREAGDAGCPGRPRSSARPARSPRPEPLLGPLTHDEAPVRPRRSADTGPGLGSDSTGSPVPPPPLVSASGGSEAVSLEASSAGNFHVGHPAWAGASGRRDCATARLRGGGRSVRPRRCFRRRFAARWVVSGVKARREKLVKDPESLLPLFPWTEKDFRNTELGIFIFNSNSKEWRIR